MLAMGGGLVFGESLAMIPVLALRRGEPIDVHHERFRRRKFYALVHYCLSPVTKSLSATHTGAGNAASRTSYPSVLPHSRCCTFLIALSLSIAHFWPASAERRRTRIPPRSAHMPKDEPCD